METIETAFPDVYRDISTEKLISVYEHGPQRLQQAIDGLSCEEMLAEARPGKWSVQEIVLHLADAEIMGSTRIRQCYAQPGCTFIMYDQNIWANILDYRHLDKPATEQAVQLFSSLRSANAALFRRCNDLDWRKTGYHLEQGYLTLRNLLELYADHSERHIGQILQIRDLLGKPLHMQLLLEKWLY